MSVAELLEREAIADGEQLLSWAEARAAELIAELDAEDPLRSLLGPGGEAGPEAELDAVPVTRRRRREPSSPQPKSADELPPPPEHPRLAEGEPEPMLETVDTGPIDLEEEIVRRRMREDSWAIAARDVEGMIQDRAAEAEAASKSAIAQEIAEADEPSIEIDIDMEGSADEEAQADSDEAEVELAVEVEPPAEVESELEPGVAEPEEPAIQVEALADEAHDRSEVAEPTLTLEPTLLLDPTPSEPEAPLEPATRAISTDSPIERPAEPSSPELPVVVGPAESIDDPVELPEPTIDIAPLEAASEGDEGESDEGESDEFEVDELDELEVDELVEIDEEPEDDEPSSHKPPPPPPKSAPPPIRNEVADLIAELSAVQTGDTAVTKIDDVEGAPPPAEAPPAEATPEATPSDDIDIDVD